MRLTAEQIMAAPHRATKVVRVEGWGGDVLIGTISKAAQQDAVKAETDADGKVDWERVERRYFQALMIEPALTAEQVDTLWEQDHFPLNHILQEWYALGRMTAAGYVTKAGVEDAERKFCDGPAGDVSDAAGGEPREDAS